MTLPHPRMKHINGVAKMAYEIPCKGCRRGFVACKSKHIKGDKNGSSGVIERQITRDMEAAGWTVRAGLKRCECPDCQAKRAQEKQMTKTADVPREATMKDRRKIADLLETVYDVKRQMYQEAESDASVAQTLTVPRKWVEDVRVMLFGEFDRNEKGETHNKELDALEQRLQAEMARVGDVKANLDMIAAEIKAMRV